MLHNTNFLLYYWNSIDSYKLLPQQYSKILWNDTKESISLLSFMNHKHVLVFTFIISYLLIKLNFI